MMYEKLYKMVSEKIDMTKEEFERIFNEKKAELEKLGIKENLEERALIATKNYFRKIIFSPIKKFECVIIGIKGITDWAEIARNKAIQLGVPGKYPQGWIRAGSDIPEHDYQLTLIGVINIENKNYIAFLHYRKNDAINIDLNNIIGKKVEFSGIISQTTTENILEINVVNGVKNLFKIKEEIENFRSFLLENFKQFAISLKTLKEEIANMNTTNMDKKLVLIKCNIERINLLNSKSNLIVVNDETFDFDTEGVLCWVPKYIDINFSELSQDVLILGSPSYNSIKEQLSINVYSICVPDIYKIDTNLTNNVLMQDSFENTFLNEKDDEVILFE